MSTGGLPVESTTTAVARFYLRRRHQWKGSSFRDEKWQLDYAMGAIFTVGPALNNAGVTYDVWTITTGVVPPCARAELTW